MKITALDHLVLTVRDLAATCEFYARVLGMEIVISEDGRYALHFGEQKINLHKAGREFEPKALLPTPGAGDLCFLTDLALADVIAHVEACGVPILAGPVPRAGARGPMASIYLRDPDGNLVEVANYAEARES
jgi:catechol 2,3-dioxygenase-like lactoylglutathione lyase family enzyme